MKSVERTAGAGRCEPPHPNPLPGGERGNNGARPRAQTDSKENSPLPSVGEGARDVSENGKKIPLSQRLGEGRGEG